MGVKGLNQLLRRVCGSAHESMVPMCNFSGKKIAIDAALYVCAFKMRHNYVESIVEFLTTLRQHNIHPFFVFDGVAPIEKRNERVERANKRAAARDRIGSLERDLEAYKTTGELSGPLKALEFKNGRKLAPVQPSAVRIQEYIDKLKSQILVVNQEDFDTLKSVLECFDVPYVTADGEGEFLCAALARHGLVDAAMSTDTDVLACQCPIAVTRIEGDYFHVVSLADILKHLKMTSSEFVDLCIMCGTDFNGNIPKIGPSRAYDLLLKYRTIESLPDDLKKDALCYKRVREIFAFSDTVPSIAVPFSGRVDYDRLRAWTDNVETIKKRLKTKLKKRTDSEEKF